MFRMLICGLLVVLGFSEAYSQGGACSVTYQFDCDPVNATECYYRYCVNSVCPDDEKEVRAPSGGVSEPNVYDGIAPAPPGYSGVTAFTKEEVHCKFTRKCGSGCDTLGSLEVCKAGTGDFTGEDSWDDYDPDNNFPCQN